MEETFYADRLATHGISVVVPDAAGRAEVDRVVFDEITQGHFRDSSRASYVEIMRDLQARGADAVVLACTEIGLLVPPRDAPLPVIDSATAHADLLVELALRARRPTLSAGGRRATTRRARPGRAESIRSGGAAAPRPPHGGMEPGASEPCELRSAWPIRASARPRAAGGRRSRRRVLRRSALAAEKPMSARSLAA